MRPAFAIAPNFHLERRLDGSVARGRGRWLARAARGRNCGPRGGSAGTRRRGSAVRNSGASARPVLGHARRAGCRGHRRFRHLRGGMWGNSWRSRSCRRRPKPSSICWFRTWVARWMRPASGRLVNFGDEPLLLDWPGVRLRLGPGEGCRLDPRSPPGIVPPAEEPNVMVAIRQGRRRKVARILAQMLERKTRAATAGRGRLRIVDLEQLPDQIVDKVDLRPRHVVHRDRIDQHHGTVAR